MQTTSSPRFMAPSECAADAPGAAVVTPSASTATLPRLAPGVEPLGEYKGSGLTEATYLVRNGRGQVVQLSRLLHIVMREIDGSSTANDIAGRVTAAFARSVSVENIKYLLGNKLAPLGLLATSESSRAVAQPVDPDILALKVRRTLVPAPTVQRIARLFQPLFHPLAVVAVLGCLIASDAWLLGNAQLGSGLRYVLIHPLLLLLVLGLAVLSMLFHECGHAAACRYGGARPGVIGAGFYVVWPAFYTNVTDSYRLGRAGRVRTDLGGVYFNAVFLIPLMAAYLATGYLPLLAAVILIHLEIFQQLLPSLRFDGYFILADLIGVPDLFRRIVPTLGSMIPGRPIDSRVRNLKRAARVTLTAWVLLVVPLLAVELGFVILNGPGLVRTFAQSVHAQAHAVVTQFGRVEVPAGLVGVISLLFLVLPMAGLCYILLLTGRRAFRNAVTVTRRHPRLRYPSLAAVVLVATALAAYWGVLPFGPGGSSTSHPPGATAASQPQPLPAQPHSGSPTQVQADSDPAAGAPSGIPAYPRPPGFVPPTAQQPPTGTTTPPTSTPPTAQQPPTGTTTPPTSTPPTAQQPPTGTTTPPTSTLPTAQLPPTAQQPPTGTTTPPTSTPPTAQQPPTGTTTPPTSTPPAAQQPPTGTTTPPTSTPPTAQQPPTGTTTPPTSTPPTAQQPPTGTTTPPTSSSYSRRWR